MAGEIQNKPEAKRKGNPAWGTQGQGRSGNPGGRPKIAAEIKEMALCLCPEAIKFTAELMRNSEADFRDRLRAAENLLDRGLGKPVQAIMTPEGENLRVELVEIIRSDKRTSKTE